MAVAEECIQKKAVVYDGDGDQHYDTISAFIKSIRGSDPDAALYWLAKMIHAGEDPRFITRRLMISAAEDIGWPIPWHCAQYLRPSGCGIHRLARGAHPHCRGHGLSRYRPQEQQRLHRDQQCLGGSENRAHHPVPKHLRDSHYAGAKRLGNGEEYKYAHAYDDHFVAQDYLGVDIRFYDPTEQGVEKKIKDRVLHWRSLQEKAKQDGNQKAKAALRAEMASIRVRPDERSLDSAAICQHVKALPEWAEFESFYCLPPCRMNQCG